MITKKFLRPTKRGLKLILTSAGAILAVFAFQNCGDPGFNTAGPYEDVDPVRIVSISIENVTKVNSEIGSIDLVTNTVNMDLQSRPLTSDEITQATTVFQNLKMCRHLLPSGTDPAQCLLIASDGYLLTQSDGTELWLSAVSICNQDALCPSSAEALRTLFESFLIFP